MAASVWIQAHAVELPATEFGMLGQQLPGGIPRGVAGQSEDEIGVLGHYRHGIGTCHPLLGVGMIARNEMRNLRR